MSLENDYDAEDLGDEIVGLQLKCGKGGNYTFDSVPITIGPDGFQFTPFPETAKWGFIRWEDGFPVEKDLHNWFDPPSGIWRVPPFGKAPEGWSFYSGVYGVSGDDQLATFTSALGLRRTLKNIITQYRARGRLLLPVCTLATRPRGDDYGNIDPVLNITTKWIDIGVYATMFPGLIAMPRPAAPLTALTDAPAKLDKLAREASAPAEAPPPPTVDDINWRDAIGGDHIPY